ncbi:Rib/alpha-like domain-containing protein, partial [uncultured Ligilactobacillus sp.]
MLSKNNTNLYTEKLAPKRQKFAIRKFTIGVASVLVGTTFALYGGSSQVLADQNNASTAQQVTSDDQVQKSADTPATIPETEKVQNSVADQAPQINLATPDSNETPKDYSGPDNSVTPRPHPESTDSNVTPQASSDTTDNDTSSQTPDLQVETPSQTASHVSDMLQFQTALNDKNVSEIVLDKDVVNNTDDYVSVDKAGSARKVTVWGSKVDDDKTTSLNLGDYSLYFYNKTATGEHKWDLTFKNVNVSTNNPRGYGVVSFQNNGSGAKVAFDNVLASGNGVLVYAPNADVSLRDTVATPTYVENSPSANVTANTVGLSGKVVLTSGVDDTSTAQNIYADGKVTVNSGADVVLTTNNSKSNRLQNLTAGSLDVKKGAKLSVKANTTASNVRVPSGSSSSLVENSGAVYVTDGDVKVDGELTVDATTKDKNSTSVVAAVVLGASANTQNDLVVGSTGELVVNATGSPNTRGVYFISNNHAFGMQKGAKATFKMGHGVSNAVFNPDNLVLNEGSKLVVETYQDNNGVTNPGLDANDAGAHSGVITLDLNSSNRPNNSEVTVGNVHGALVVKKDALLKVVRKVDDATKQAATPLLSFGGTGSNNGTNSLDVDHGSVVLEDALQKDSLTHSNLGYYSYLGITDSEHSPVYPLGMVSMWGIGSIDRVNVVAPKLFKMERTGKQKGMLFRLEAIDNKITVTADTDKSVPVKYGTLGNVRYNNKTVSQAKNYQWDVEKLKSVNRLGDYSMNYRNGNTSGTPFGLSPVSSVSFNQETPQEAKDDFNNYFNWWSATDLEMGSDLKVYSPFYRPLVVMKNENQSEVVSYRNNDLPSSATYKLFDKNNDLSWVKVDTTGKVTVSPTDATSLGLHNVSVEASFDNGQKVVAYVPVMVLDSDQRVVFNGENMLVGKTEPVFTHKTSDKNLVLDPVQAVNSLTAYTRDDKTGKYLQVAKYTPNSEGTFTEKTTGKALNGVKVTWVEVPTTVVPKDSSDTETSSVSAAVNVVDQEVDFPKLGKFPDLGNLPVVVTMYGASAKPDVSATSDLPQTLPQAQSVVSMPELTEKHHAAVADVSWKTRPDLTRPERQVSGVVNVDFVDGTKLEVPVSVEVKPNMAELNDPVGQDVYTTLDKEPIAEKGVANTASMPTGTQYSWKTPVNIYTLGEKPGKVVVTYPDGTKDEVLVRVLVSDPNADKNKVPEDTLDVDKYVPQGQEVTTVQDQVPQAESGVSNKSELPKETKYAWKTPLNVSTPGETQGTVVVTYPDGSQEEVPVDVTVTPLVPSKDPEKTPTDAEKYTPQGQEVTTVQDQMPQAESGVANKSELPKETKYAWKTLLNVSTPGEKQGTVVVTYPDGSQEEVPVKVVVTKTPEKTLTDAEKYTPQGQEVTTAQDQTPQAESGVANKSELPKETKYAWKTPLNVST